MDGRGLETAAAPTGRAAPPGASVSPWTAVTEERVRERWEVLAPDVARRRLPGWDATVGAVAGPEGILVVDTGATLREGAEIRREVRALFGRPVTHVALTHPHFDHVLGTAAFAGVQVYGAAGLADVLERGREALRADAVRHGADPETVAEAVDLLVCPRH